MPRGRGYLPLFKLFSTGRCYPTTGTRALVPIGVTLTPGIRPSSPRHCSSLDHVTATVIDTRWHSPFSV